MSIVVFPGILNPTNYLSWQKLFAKIVTLNCKINTIENVCMYVYFSQMVSVVQTLLTWVY